MGRGSSKVAGGGGVPKSPVALTDKEAEAL